MRIASITREVREVGINNGMPSIYITLSDSAFDYDMAAVMFNFKNRNKFNNRNVVFLGYNDYDPMLEKEDISKFMKYLNHDYLFEIDTQGLLFPNEFILENSVINIRMTDINNEINKKYFSEETRAKIHNSDRSYLFFIIELDKLTRQDITKTKQEINDFIKSHHLLPSDIWLLPKDRKNKEKEMYVLQLVQETNCNSGISKTVKMRT